ncbi:hypothetical protein BC628DRAFT_1377669 [Trametes gibbosa]|nr:hypothetical protein BC628DRAFT_1377669 [Trametes gibbosa]
MSSDSGSSSDSERASSSSPPPNKRTLVEEEEVNDESDDSSSDSEDSGDESDADEGEGSDVPVLSHAEKRRQKRKEDRSAQKKGVTPAEDVVQAKVKSKVKNTAELPPSKVPKRQNSVWVGNLSFKTTPASLRNFFDGVGEITRIHMPMKMVTGGPEDRRPRQENRGFAYVDFATQDAKTVAITMSENPLDGRRLLIKDGDDFNGRPAPTPAAPGAEGAEPSASQTAGLTKTAQKILRVQKQPPGPTLFFGNLGFETTEKSIRDLLDSHRPKPSASASASASASVAAGAETDAAKDKESEKAGEKGKDDGKWIRKVRMGTFEDSGKCKGWAFVDFTAPEHATAALTNPRNHQLDGRKLVVEYASPDAVRRGGGAGPRPDRAPKKRGLAEDGGGDSRPPANRRRVEEGAGQAGEEAPRGARGRRGPAAAAPGRGGKAARPRTRPGAALALAKREDVAIVPSQGKKIVF